MTLRQAQGEGFGSPLMLSLSPFGKLRVKAQAQSFMLSLSKHEGREVCR